MLKGVQTEVPHSPPPLPSPGGLRRTLPCLCSTTLIPSHSGGRPRVSFGHNHTRTLSPSALRRHWGLARRRSLSRNTFLCHLTGTPTVSERDHQNEELREGRGGRRTEGARRSVEGRQVHEAPLQWTPRLVQKDNRM